MAMASSMMAMQAQAAQWLVATKAALEAAGHGFTSDDLAAFAASSAAQPVTEVADVGDPAQLQAEAMEAAQRSMAADWPPGGLAPDDPRLAPIEGVTMAMAAIAAKLVGWSKDPEDAARAARCLGVDRDVFERASTGFSDRVRDDIVLAAFYGQLFSQA